MAIGAGESVADIGTGTRARVRDERQTIANCIAKRAVRDVRGGRSFERHRLDRIRYADGREGKPQQERVSMSDDARDRHRVRMIAFSTSTAATAPEDRYVAAPVQAR